MIIVSTLGSTLFLALNEKISKHYAQIPPQPHFVPPGVSDASVANSRRPSDQPTEISQLKINRNDTFNRFRVPTARVATKQLNIRSGPGTGYSVIGIAHYSDIIRIFNDPPSNSWIKIRYYRTVGYVNSKLLKLGDPQKSLEKLCPISIYKNGYTTDTPSSGSLGMSFIAPESLDVWMLVLDSNGRKVSQVFIERGKTIYINGYAAGLYSLRMHVGADYSDKCQRFVHDDAVIIPAGRFKLSQVAGSLNINIPDTKTADAKGYAVWNPSTWLTQLTSLSDLAE